MTIQIPLTKGFEAIVDDVDSWVSEFKWSVKQKANGRVYAVRTIHSSETKSGKTSLPMHRAILGDSCVGMDVDHVDGNGLNNRRSNLRAVSRKKNMHNVSGAYASNMSSGILGVHWHKRDKRWLARIEIDNKLIHLGRFTTIEAAAAARLAAEREYRGVQPRRASAHDADPAPPALPQDVETKEGGVS